MHNQNRHNPYRGVARTIDDTGHTGISFADQRVAAGPSRCELLARKAHSNWTPGNRIVVLENGDEIFPAMLEAIRNAEDSILFLTYVYWEGEIATQFAELLAEKARNGVRCQVLLDDFGSKRTRHWLLDMMEEAGVILAKYNPFSFRHPLRYQHRTHRKILVCDSEIGFVGGVGIADAWKGDARHPGERHDFHFRAEGPCVNALAIAFRENWESPWTKMRDGSTPERMVPFDPGPDEQVELPEDHSGFDDDAWVLPLLSSPNDAESEAADVYELLLDTAKSSVRIISAYLIPDRDMMALFRRTAARGVDIELIVPAGPHKDSWLAQSRSRAAWPELLDCGVKVHLYQPTMCHAKVTIIDDWLTTIGSINFDLLSFRLNEEANLIVRSRHFAALMTEKFEQDKSRSVATTVEELAARGWWPRFKESCARRFPLPYWSEGCDY